MLLQRKLICTLRLKTVTVVLTKKCSLMALQVLVKPLLPNTGSMSYQYQFCCCSEWCFQFLRGHRALLMLWVCIWHDYQDGTITNRMFNLQISRICSLSIMFVEELQWLPHLLGFYTQCMLQARASSLTVIVASVYVNKCVWNCVCCFVRV